MESICQDLFDLSANTVFTLSATEGVTAEWQNDVLQRRAYDTRVFIGYELKLVPEVEHVFVSHEDDSGKVLRVTVVVDKRDPELRAAIYKREQAIMDELRNFDFDFHILAREGRPLDALITETGAGDAAI